MKLIHYTDKELSLEPRVYDQKEQHIQCKPRGLWVSVEGEYDWEWWCESENFRLENLVVRYEVELKDNADILHLKTKEEIYKFTESYSMSTRSWDREHDTYEIRWDDLKIKYQGIIISPYQWDCRLAIGSSWYYGWDCASGCIWDLTCIKEFKLMERNDK